MSILRSLVHWYVWWGGNAFYYYSRPFVWAWSLIRAADPYWQVEQLEEKDESLFSQAEAFRRDVAAVEREYTKALQRHHADEQMRGARISAGVDIKVAQQRLRDAKRAWWS